MSALQLSSHGGPEVATVTRNAPATLREDFAGVIGDAVPTMSA